MRHKIHIIHAPQPDARAVTEKIQKIKTPYTACYVIDGRLYWFYVYSGYPFDGASIPWFAKWILRMESNGLSQAAALAHDDLYETTGRKYRTEKSWYTYWGDYGPVEGVPTLDECNEILDRGNGWTDLKPPKFSKALSDQLFREILKHSGTPRHKAGICYAALRTSGWVAWRRSKRRNERRAAVCR